MTECAKYNASSWPSTLEAGLSLQPVHMFKAAIYERLLYPGFVKSVGSAPIPAMRMPSCAALKPTDWISRGIDPEENDKRPLGSFGRVASRMNCRYRAPVPFTPLVATVLLASQSIGSRCDGEKASHQAFRRILSGRDQRLDQHRFRPLGKLVVGNLDRIADVDDVGN